MEVAVLKSLLAPLIHEEKNAVNIYITVHLAVYFIECFWRNNASLQFLRLPVIERSCLGHFFHHK